VKLKDQKEVNGNDTANVLERVIFCKGSLKELQVDIANIDGGQG